MPKLDTLTIIVRGKHDTGRTTAASLIKMFLEENGYLDVKVEDTQPLPAEQKDEFMRRFERNKTRPVRIVVELEA